MRWHSLWPEGEASGVMCLLASVGLGCSPQGHSQSGQHETILPRLTSTQLHRTELSKNDTAPQGPSMSASAFGQWEEELLGQSFDAFESIVVDTVDRYRNHEFRQYKMFGVFQGLVDQIDNEEMLKFLHDRGVPLVPEKLLTSNNVIAYLQHKNLGTPAAYAWLDLTKGNPDSSRGRAGLADHAARERPRVRPHLRLAGQRQADDQGRWRSLGRYLQDPFSRHSPSRTATRRR